MDIFKNLYMNGLAGVYHPSQQAKELGEWTSFTEDMHRRDAGITNKPLAQEWSWVWLLPARKRWEEAVSEQEEAQKELFKQRRADQKTWLAEMRAKGAQARAARRAGFENGLHGLRAMTDLALPEATEEDIIPDDFSSRLTVRAVEEKPIYDDAFWASVYTGSNPVRSEVKTSKAKAPRRIIARVASFIGGRRYWRVASAIYKDGFSRIHFIWRWTSMKNQVIKRPVEAWQIALPRPDLEEIGFFGGVITPSIPLGTQLSRKQREGDLNLTHDPRLAAERLALRKSAKKTPFVYKQQRVKRFTFGKNDSSSCFLPRQPVDVGLSKQFKMADKENEKPSGFKLALIATEKQAQVKTEQPPQFTALGRVAGDLATSLRRCMHDGSIVGKAAFRWYGRMAAETTPKQAYDRLIEELPKIKKDRSCEWILWRKEQWRQSRISDGIPVTSLPPAYSFKLARSAIQADIELNPGPDRKGKRKASLPLEGESPQKIQTIEGPTAEGSIEIPKEVLPCGHVQHDWILGVTWEGYCYLELFPPERRLDRCLRYGRWPTIFDLCEDQEVIFKGKFTPKPITQTLHVDPDLGYTLSQLVNAWDGPGNFWQLRVGGNGDIRSPLNDKGKSLKPDTSDSVTKSFIKSSDEEEHFIRKREQFDLLFKRLENKKAEGDLDIPDDHQMYDNGYCYLRMFPLNLHLAFATALGAHPLLWSILEYDAYIVRTGWDYEPTGENLHVFSAPEHEALLDLRVYVEDSPLNLLRSVGSTTISISCKELDDLKGRITRQDRIIRQQRTVISDLRKSIHPTFGDVDLERPTHSRSITEPTRSRPERYDPNLVNKGEGSIQVGSIWCGERSDHKTLWTAVKLAAKGNQVLADGIRSFNHQQGFKDEDGTPDPHSSCIEIDSRLFIAESAIKSFNHEIGFTTKTGTEQHPSCAIKDCELAETRSALDNAMKEVEFGTIPIKATRSSVLRRWFYRQQWQVELGCNKYAHTNIPLLASIELPGRANKACSDEVDTKWYVNRCRIAKIPSSLWEHLVWKDKEGNWLWDRHKGHGFIKGQAGCSDPPANGGWLETRNTHLIIASKPLWNGQKRYGGFRLSPRGFAVFWQGLFPHQKTDWAKGMQRSHGDIDRWLSNVDYNMPDITHYEIKTKHWSEINKAKLPQRPPPIHRDSSPIRRHHKEKTTCFDTDEKMLNLRGKYLRDEGPTLFQKAKRQMGNFLLSCPRQYTQYIVPMINWVVSKQFTEVEKQHASVPGTPEYKKHNDLVRELMNAPCMEDEWVRDLTSEGVEPNPGPVWDFFTVRIGTIISLLGLLAGLWHTLAALVNEEVRRKASLGKAVPISNHMIPKQGRFDHMLGIAMHGTRGDHVPLQYIAKVISSMNIPVHLYDVRLMNAHDLAEIEAGRLRKDAYSWVETNAFTRQGFRQTIAPYVHGANNWNIELGSGPEWVRPTWVEKGDNMLDFLAVWAYQLLAKANKPDLRVGILKGCNVPRSSNGITELFKSEPMKTRKPAGWVAGSGMDENIPEHIRMNYPRITNPDHESAFREYEVIHNMGGAGTMQTAISCGAKPEPHRRILDRDFHTLPTPSDYQNPGWVPLMALLNTKFDLDLPAHLKWYLTFWHIVNTFNWATIGGWLIRILVACSLIGNNWLLPVAFILSYPKTVEFFLANFNLDGKIVLEWGARLMWLSPVFYLWTRGITGLLLSISCLAGDRLWSEISLLVAKGGKLIYVPRVGRNTTLPFPFGHWAAVDSFGTRYEGRALETGPNWLNKPFSIQAKQHGSWVLEKDAVVIPAPLSFAGLRQAVEKAEVQGYGWSHNCITVISPAILQTGCLYSMVALYTLVLTCKALLTAELYSRIKSATTIYEDLGLVFAELDGDQLLPPLPDEEDLDLTDCAQKEGPKAHSIRPLSGDPSRIKRLTDAYEIPKVLELIQGHQFDGSFYYQPSSWLVMDTSCCEDGVDTLIVGHHRSYLIAAWKTGWVLGLGLISPQHCFKQPGGISIPTTLGLPAQLHWPDHFHVHLELPIGHGQLLSPNEAIIDDWKILEGNHRHSHSYRPQGRDMSLTKWTTIPDNSDNYDDIIKCFRVSGQPYLRRAFYTEAIPLETMDLDSIAIQSFTVTMALEELGLDPVIADGMSLDLIRKEGERKIHATDLTMLVRPTPPRVVIQEQILAWLGQFEELEFVREVTKWLLSVIDQLIDKCRPVINLLFEIGQYLAELAHKGAKVAGEALRAFIDLGQWLIDYLIRPHSVNKRLKAVWAIGGIFKNPEITSRARFQAQIAYAQYVTENNFGEDYEAMLHDFRKGADGLVKPAEMDKLGGPQYRKVVFPATQVHPKQVADAILKQVDTPPWRKLIIDPVLTDRIESDLEAGGELGFDQVYLTQAKEDMITRSLDRYRQLDPVEALPNGDKRALTSQELYDADAAAYAVCQSAPKACLNRDWTSLEACLAYEVKKYSPGVPFIGTYKNREEMAMAGWTKAAIQTIKDRIASGRYLDQFYHAFGKSQVISAKALGEGKDPRTVIAESILSKHHSNVFDFDMMKRDVWRETGIGSGMPLNQNMEAIFKQVNDYTYKVEADATKLDSHFSNYAFQIHKRMAYYGFKDHPIGDKLTSIAAAKGQAIQNAYIFAITEKMDPSKPYANVVRKIRGGGTGQNNTSGDNTWLMKGLMASAWTRYWRIKGDSMLASPTTFFDPKYSYFANTSDDNIWGVNVPIDWQIFDRCAQEVGLYLTSERSERIEDIQYLGKYVERPTPEEQIDVDRLWKRKGWTHPKPEFIVKQNVSGLLLRRSGNRYYQTRAPGPSSQGTRGSDYLKCRLQQTCGQVYITAFLPQMYRRLRDNFIIDAQRYILEDTNEGYYKIATEPRTLEKLDYLISVTKGDTLFDENIKIIHIPKGEFGRLYTRGQWRALTSTQLQRLLELKKMNFPSYSRVLEIHCNEPRKPLDYYDKLKAKLAKAARRPDEGLRMAVGGLRHFCQSLPRKLWKMQTAPAAIMPDELFVTRKMRNEAWMWHMGATQISELEAALAKGPYGSCSDPQAFYAKYHNNSEFRNEIDAYEEKPHILQNHVFFQTILYYLSWYLESKMLGVLFFGTIYWFIMFMLVDMSKLYGLANNIYFHGTGRSSEIISSMVPRDPYVHIKRFCIWTEEFVPDWVADTVRLDLILREISRIPEIIAQVFNWGQEIKAIPHGDRINPWIMDATQVTDKLSEVINPHQKYAFVSAATGTGKTAMMVPALASIHRSSVPEMNIHKAPVTWLVVPRRVLRDDYSPGDPRLEGKVQVLKRGEKPDRKNNWMFICTYGHLLQRIRSGDTKKHDLYCFDEFHELSGEMILAQGHIRNKGAPIVFLSATPRHVQGLDNGYLHVAQHRRHNETTAYTTQGSVAQLWSYGHQLDSEKAKNALVVVPSYREIEEVIQGLNNLHPGVPVIEASARTRTTFASAWADNHRISGGCIAVCSTVIDAGYDFKPAADMLIDSGRYIKIHEGVYHGQQATPDYLREQRWGRVGRNSSSNNGIVIAHPKAGTGESPIQYPSGNLFAEEETLPQRVEDGIHRNILGKFFKIANLEKMDNPELRDWPYYRIRETIMDEKIRFSLNFIFLAVMSGVKSRDLQRFYLQYAIQKHPLPEEYEWLSSNLPPSHSEMYVAWNAVWQYINPKADLHFTTKRNGREILSNLIWPQAGQWVYDSFEDQVKRIRITATTEAEIYSELDSKQQEIIQALTDKIKKQGDKIKAMEGKAQTSKHSLKCQRPTGTTTQMVKDTLKKTAKYTFHQPPHCWQMQREIDGYCSS